MTNMPRLHIEQQHALIGINTTNAKVQLSSQHPQMHITSGEVPDMQTDVKQPAFSVDWQRVRSESGLPGPITKSKQNAAEGKQQALQYTGEVAEEGNYLAKTELGGNRVAAIEKNKNFDPMKEINIGSMPQSLPNIQWEPGSININWSKTQMQVEWDSEYMPTFSVEPHAVEIFLRNKPYIRITVMEDPSFVIVDEQV